MERTSPSDDSEVASSSAIRCSMTTCNFLDNTITVTAKDKEWGVTAGEYLLVPVSPEPSLEIKAEIARIQGGKVTELRLALRRLLDYSYKNTCQHDETHRGGVLWEICDSCGAKWADDRGGKPLWMDPPEWTAAEIALKD